MCYCTERTEFTDKCVKNEKKPKSSHYVVELYPTITIKIPKKKVKIDIYRHGSSRLQQPTQKNQTRRGFSTHREEDDHRPQSRIETERI